MKRFDFPFRLVTSELPVFLMLSMWLCLFGWNLYLFRSGVLSWRHSLVTVESDGYNPYQRSRHCKPWRFSLCLVAWLNCLHRRQQIFPLKRSVSETRILWDLGKDMLSIKRRLVFLMRSLSMSVHSVSSLEGIEVLRWSIPICLYTMCFSYKLWYNYLRFRKRHLRGKSPIDPLLEEINNVFERALVFMHKVILTFCCINYFSLVLCLCFNRCRGYGPNIVTSSWLNPNLQELGECLIERCVHCLSPSMDGYGPFT